MGLALSPGTRATLGLSTLAVSKERSDCRRDVRPAARAATRRIANPDPIDRAEEGLVNERNGYHKNAHAAFFFTGLKYKESLRALLSAISEPSEKARPQ